MVLVGRDLEVGTIGALIDGITGQTPFVLSVTGPPGSGRTALLDHARRVAGDAGANVLAARGSRDSVDLAYGGLLTLLRPLERDLDALAGDRADVLRSALAMRRERVDPLDVRLALFRVLTVAAEQHPLTVLLDDSDSIDAATLDALRFAFGRLGVDRVGAVVTSLGIDGPLTDVATHRLSIGPLDLDVLAAIVEEQADCVPEAARACAAWSDGNPLVALELARSLSTDERAGRTTLPSVPRPTTRIVERMQADLSALSSAARRALVVVAADRSGSVPVVLKALAALGEPSTGIDEAESAGVLVVDRDRVRFRHSLQRPLAYHLVAARSRRAAHRAVASALVEPEQAAERAWQLVESCSGPDDDVATLLDLVADDAVSRGALSEAASTFERAARLSTDASARNRRLRAASVAHLDALACQEARSLAEDAFIAGDTDAGLLVVEAIERRDGPGAALAWIEPRGAPAAVRADLLLAAGREDDARATLARGDPDASDPSVDQLRAALMSMLDRAAGDERATSLAAHPALDAVRRRAWRRWLEADAARGVPPAAAATVDEVLACALAAKVNGRLDQARAFCDQASVLVPPECVALTARVATLAAQCEQAEPDPTFAALTPAERRVAHAVAEGRTNREVADHLFLSVKTVDFHLQGIYRKLGVRSRTELALLLSGKGGRA